MFHDRSANQVRHRQCGSSLLEVMMATAAALVILAATMQVLSSLQRQFMNQRSVLAQQQDLRLSLELLEQELHLAESDSISIMKQDELEFGANINGFITSISAPAVSGQTTIPVIDGRGWPERKTVVVCWVDECEAMTLARDGQRALLTLTQPIAAPIPTGASVSIRNRVRYYSRFDDRGNPRFLRMVDGGASVLIGDIQEARFSYWDERGIPVTGPATVKRIVVEISLRGSSTKMVREISLRA